MKAFTIIGCICRVLTPTQDFRTLPRSIRTAFYLFMDSFEKNGGETSYDMIAFLRNFYTKDFIRIADSTSKKAIPPWKGAKPCQELLRSIIRSNTSRILGKQSNLQVEMLKFLPQNTILFPIRIWIILKGTPPLTSPTFLVPGFIYPNTSNTVGNGL